MMAKVALSVGMFHMDSILVSLLVVLVPHSFAEQLRKTRSTNAGNNAIALFVKVIKKLNNCLTFIF